MSRSYSHGSSHSRGNRSRADSSISVTQASFQDLGLHETAGTHRSSSSSYHSHDQRSPRSAYRRDNIPSNYLQTEYNTASYAPAPPSESFIDPQRLSTNYIPPVAEQSDYLTPQSSSYSRANMGYSYAPESFRPTSPYVPSRSPTAPAYTYAGTEPSTQRSTSGSSGPSGPTILPSSTSGRVGPEELEIVRQRRRDLHEARRSNKLRVRRALPGFSQAGSSVAPVVSHSIDFVVAPPTSSSYDISGTYDPYRAPAQHSNYVAGPSSTSLYPGYPYGQQSAYPSSGSIPHSPGSGTSHGGSTGTSPGGDGRPVGETRSRPQCWDHGCNGRQFSTFSNLLRHQREKSGMAAKSTCPRCGAEFTRTTARNGHVAEGKCTRSDRRKSPHDR